MVYIKAAAFTINEPNNLNHPNEMIGDGGVITYPVPQRLHHPKEHFVSMYSCACSWSFVSCKLDCFVAFWPNQSEIICNEKLFCKSLFITSALLAVASVSVNRKAANQNLLLNDKI